jgi:hypothetical protein
MNANNPLSRKNTSYWSPFLELPPQTAYPLKIVVVIIRKATELGFTYLIDGGREEDNYLWCHQLPFAHFTHTYTHQQIVYYSHSVPFRYRSWGEGDRSSWDIRCRKSNHRECRFASTKYVAAAVAIRSNKWAPSRVGEERRGGC